MRPRVALVTCAAVPLLYEEEAEFVAMLRARGVGAEAVVWNDSQAAWHEFSCVILRSTWDYFERYGEFRAWLTRMQEEGVAFWNRPSLVAWNSDKFYLRDLQKRGVRIVPTVFCERGRGANLAQILRQQGWESAVAKPAVSGGSYRTYRFDAAGAAAVQPEVDAIFAATGVLVQPFFPEIQSEGEWSLIFLDGVFSHAVIKTPAPEDYRIQWHFGGVFKKAQPETWLLAQAEKVLAALPERPVYARIDGLCRGKDFYLMEAELIEPYLYSAGVPEAARSYVDLVLRLACAPAS